MKSLKTIFLFTLLLSFTILSCSSSSSDSDSEPQTIDKIELSLTVSKTAYQNANTGDWIAITATEYGILAEALDNVTKSGMTDEHYSQINSISSVASGTNGITMANNNGASMPNNSYIFAFKYYVTEDNVETSKVKVSSLNPVDGYTDLGSTLPIHNSGENYFVLKRNNSPTTNTGYLAVFCPKKMGFGYMNFVTTYYYSYGDNNTLSVVGSTYNALIIYQGLSTTQKQWD